MPETQTDSRPSSTSATGMNLTLLSSPATRTPSWPASEKISAERGIAVASCEVSVTVISQVTPSAIEASALSIIASTG